MGENDTFTIWDDDDVIVDAINWPVDLLIPHSKDFLNKSLAVS